jgi:hypothetical protein
MVVTNATASTNVSNPKGASTLQFLRLATLSFGESLPDESNDEKRAAVSSPSCSSSFSETCRGKV